MRVRGSRPCLHSRQIQPPTALHQVVLVLPPFRIEPVPPDGSAATSVPELERTCVGIAIQMSGAGVCNKALRG